MPERCCRPCSMFQLTFAAAGDHARAHARIQLTRLGHLPPSQGVAGGACPQGNLQTCHCRQTILECPGPSPQARCQPCSLPAACRAWWSHKGTHFALQAALHHALNAFKQLAGRQACTECRQLLSDAKHSSLRRQGAITSVLTTLAYLQD